MSRKLLRCTLTIPVQNEIQEGAIEGLFNSLAEDISRLDWVPLVSIEVQRMDRTASNQMVGSKGSQDLANLLTIKGEE